MKQLVRTAGARTRQRILQAALKQFADGGYAATSIQHIVDAARVSKPALYYHFPDKAGLFDALVDQAHDERYALMQAAARRATTTADKLVAVLAAVFDFSLRNRELMRLAFASAFAAPGEMPCQGKCREKGRRNFEFLRALMKEGQAAGELSPRFSSEELAMGIYGQLNTYVMVRLLVPDCPLDRPAAQGIVRLFLDGAANAPTPAKRALRKAFPRRAAKVT